MNGSKKAPARGAFRRAFCHYFFAEKDRRTKQCHDSCCRCNTDKIIGAGAGVLGVIGAGGGSGIAALAGDDDGDGGLPFITRVVPVGMTAPAQFAVSVMSFCSSIVPLTGVFNAAISSSSVDTVVTASSAMATTGIIMQSISSASAIARNFFICEPLLFDCPAASSCLDTNRNCPGAIFTYRVQIIPIFDDYQQ